MEQFAEDSEFLLARKNLSLKLASSWRHEHGGHGGYPFLLVGGKVDKSSTKISQTCKSILRSLYSGERSKFELERLYYSKLTVSEVEGLVEIYR